MHHRWSILVPKHPWTPVNVFLHIYLLWTKLRYRKRSLKDPKPAGMVLNRLEKIHLSIILQSSILKSITEQKGCSHVKKSMYGIMSKWTSAFTCLNFSTYYNFTCFHLWKGSYSLSFENTYSFSIETQLKFSWSLCEILAHMVIMVIILLV